MKRNRSESQFPNEFIVGVVTNSDDRVPSILASLDLKISSRRNGTTPENHDLSEYEDTMEEDINFVTMSYDVGSEKPAPEIFAAARHLVNSNWGQAKQETWLHIGDDLHKDFQGAERSGCEGLLLNRGEKPKNKDESRNVPHISDLSSLIMEIAGKGGMKRRESLRQNRERHSNLPLPASQAPRKDVSSDDDFYLIWQ